MKHFLFCFLGMIALVAARAQVPRTYSEDIKSDAGSYAGIYTVAPFEVWQVEPSVEIKKVKGVMVATYCQPSESCEESAKSSVRTLKNFSIKGNRFSCSEFKGRFVFAEITCSDGKVSKVPGLIIDSTDGFYARHILSVSSSSVLTEPGKAADYYSPLNTLNEQFSIQLPCNVVFTGADGAFALNLPGRTIREFYSGSGTWAEGVPGKGVGQWLKYDFMLPVSPVSVTIFPGHSKSEDLFKKNARIREMIITASDGSEQRANFTDVFEEQEIKLQFSQPVTWIKLEIAAVYPGSKFEDTCISKVAFNFE
jgi:hypothetical protein